MKIPAHICEAHKKEFLCRIDGEEGTVMASTKKSALKGNQLVTGDRVLLEKTGNDYQIVELVERTNELFRMITRERKKKVVAANCDLMVIATSVSRPLYKQGIIDRFSVRSFQWDLPAIVVFNKMDEFQGDFDIDLEMRRLENLGIECFEVSAEYPEYRPRFGRGSFEDLRERLSGTQSIVLGQSGVGKSRLITSISHKEVHLVSNEIVKSGKGAHTTTWAELIDCGAFSVIDSPGIRSFSLIDIEPEELIDYFPDLSSISLNCRFNDCRHEPDSKGCAFYSGEAVPQAADIIESRLESYRNLLDEVTTGPTWKRKKKSGST